MTYGRRFRFVMSVFIATVLWRSTVSADWPQMLGNALHSGNAATATLPKKLGLLAAIPMSDALLASPVVAGERIFEIDGSGMVWAIDARTLNPVWRFQTRGGVGNCNNVAAPAVIGQYLHVGTMAGYYYVLDVATGDVIHRSIARSRSSPRR